MTPQTAANAGKYAVLDKYAKMASAQRELATRTAMEHTSIHPVTPTTAANAGKHVAQALAAVVADV